MLAKYNSDNVFPQKLSIMHDRQKFTSPTIIGFLIIVLFLLLFFGSYFIKLLNSFSLKPGFLLSVLTNSGELKEENGLTNFLLLGTGGSRHEGPNLTDTLIFISLNNRSSRISLLSLPRDIWVEKLKQKLNSIYAIGQADDGNGLELAKEVVGDITGQPIHYMVVIDFNVFKEIIDLVGGIDVFVERSFDDYKYPKENGDYQAATISGEIYQHLRFTKGMTHMDGKTALKFARSRNSKDPLEGSDFARNKRQQKILLALKNKLFSQKIFADLTKIQSAYKMLLKNIDTDIRDKNLPKLIRLFFKFEEKNISPLVLDEGDENNPGFLKNPPVEKYGAWVLMPRSETWKDFQIYLNAKLNDKSVVCKNGICQKNKQNN